MNFHLWPIRHSGNLRLSWNGNVHRIWDECRQTIICRCAKQAYHALRCIRTRVIEVRFLSTIIYILIITLIQFYEFPPRQQAYWLYTAKSLFPLVPAWKKFSDFLLNHEKLDSLLKDQTNIKNENKKIEASNEFINRILTSLSNNQQIVSSSTADLSILSSSLTNISQFLQGKEETLQNDLEDEKINKVNNKIELTNSLNDINYQLNKSLLS